MLTFPGSRSYIRGDYPNELVVFRPAHEALTAAPVILCHGGGGRATDWRTANIAGLLLARRLAQKGVTAVAFTGAYLWGNDTYMSRLDAALDHAVTLGLPDVAVLGCISMGGTALRWGWTNPSRFGGASCIVPALDIENILVDNTWMQTTGTTIRRTILDAWGAGGLVLNGSAGAYASTPDHASLDLTGDLTISADITMSDWSPAGVQYICSKGGTGAASGGYLFAVLTTGQLFFQLSTGSATSSASSTANLSGLTNGTRRAVRVTLDVDNGASGHSVRFWTSSDGMVTWTQLGSTVTTAGVTSVGTNATEVRVGSDPFGGSRFIGTIRHVQIQNQANTLVLDADFASEASSTASFTDEVGRTITVGSPGVISNPALDAVDTYSPLARAGDLASFGDRIIIHYGTTDELCVAASAAAFCTASGATGVPFEGGHAVTDAMMETVSDELVDLAVLAAA